MRFRHSERVCPGNDANCQAIILLAAYGAAAHNVVLLHNSQDTLRRVSGSAAATERDISTQKASAGNLKTTRCLEKGDILLEVSLEAQSRCLLKLSNPAALPVLVTENTMKIMVFFKLQKPNYTYEI